MKITIKIQRPSGDVETVDVTKKFCGMDDTIFARIKAETIKAGRGTPLSYEIDYERTDEQIRKDAELKAYCESHDAVLNAMSY
jgi:hypothetical protein